MDGMKRIAVAMPGGKYFEQLLAAAIVPWTEGRGAELLRVNLEAANLGAICSAIEQADLLLAEISGRNARVMYAAGYAHGIGKRVIFLTQFAEDFPFALTNQQVIAYSGNAEFLRAELEALESGKGPQAAARDARGKFMELFGEILRKHGHEHRGGIELENPGTFVLLEQHMDLALVQELSRKARALGIRLKLM
jgi:hypothetical protein